MQSVNPNRRAVSIIRAATQTAGQRLRAARAAGVSADECDTVLRRILAANAFAASCAGMPIKLAQEALANAAEVARSAAILARYLATGRSTGFSVATLERALAL
jgi:hypothetical protein